MIIVTVAGHLGSDPEVRFTPSNQKVTNFRVATNIKKGQKEKTVWWRITVWGDRFDKKMSYLKKGSAVLVIGEMGIPEIYTDKEGNQQISLEMTADSIQFNPFGGKGGEKTGSSAEGSSDFGSEKDESKMFAYGQQAISKGSNSSGPAFSAGAGQANFADDDTIPF